MKVDGSEKNKELLSEALRNQKTNVAKQAIEEFIAPKQNAEPVQLDISNASQLLNNTNLEETPEQRQARIAAIAAKIKDGSYLASISTKDVAQKFISEVTTLGSVKPINDPQE